MLIAGAVLTLALVNVKLFAGEGPWWRGWADQKAYLASARAFLALDLDPAKHWYPVLYPLLGAPFAGLLAAPFVPANIACFTLAFAGFRRVAARFGVTGAGAALLWLAVYVIDFRILKLWIEPWTTTLSAALIWLALAEAADLLFAKRMSSRRAALLGVLLVAIPLVRPADLVVAGVIGLFVLWPGRHRVLAVAAGAAGMLAAYAALHLAIYGPNWPDYVILSREYGFNFADLGWRAYVLLVEPGQWFPGHAGLLQQMPWLFAGAVGLLVGLFRLSGPARTLWICLVFCALGYALLLLAYVDLLPSGMWRFNNVHYFKWLLPLFALAVLKLVGWARQGAALPAAVAGVLLLLTCIRIEPVPVLAEAPASALRFTAQPTAWTDLYLARSVIADRSGLQRNFYDYHQLADGRGGVIAVALKRDFAGGEMWQGGDAERLADWPVGSPGHVSALAGPWPRAPYQRLGSRIGFGVPCWLPIACDQTLVE